MLFADSTDQTAFWIAIITAIGTAVSTIVSNWRSADFAFKAKEASDKSVVASVHNTSLIVDNTEKTVKTQETVNGRMEELIRVASEKAHAEGVLKGKEDAALALLQAKLAEKKT